MGNECLDAAADQVAEAALHELGADPLDLPDEYADLHEFAGCYPWLDEIVQAHPHDAAIQASLRGDTAEPDAF